MSGHGTEGYVHRVDRLLAQRREAPLRPKPPTLNERPHVIIVGAGPAGTFTAHFLRQHARELGVDLRMTMFDAKDFTRSGPAGCNMCAGGITGSLTARMEACGIDLPADVIQDRVSGFRLITTGGSARIRRDGPDNTVATVFRGNGPRFGPDFAGTNVSFDDSLLEGIEGPDIEILREPVTDIHPVSDPDEPISVSYGRGPDKLRLHGDLVVGAFGLSGRLSRQLARDGVPYSPPRTVRACQAELLVGRDYIRDALHGEIQVFNLGLPRASLVAMVPKGDFLTCTMIGRQDLSIDDLLEFLDHDRVRRRLPRGWEIPNEFCYCHPGIAVTAGIHPYADRLVLVGDAACCRYYKNGLETAFDSAAIAAHVAMRLGVSAGAFRAHYSDECDRLVNRDNRYGRALFRANNVIAGNRAWSRAFLALCRAGGGKVSTRMREVLWALFSGDRPYRQIVKQTLNPRLMFVAAWKALVHTFRRH